MNALKTFRYVGLAEGVSFLVLLFIAMPLKYWLGLPLAVRIVGAAHGILFLAFLAMLFRVWLELRWSFGKVALAFLASFLPFGTIWMDRQWKAEEHGLRAP